MLSDNNLLFTMRFSTSAVLVTMLGWIGAATAHNIQLKAHSRECFHEKLHKDDKMTVTFQVGDREFGGSGNLEIDFWVCCAYPWSSPQCSILFLTFCFRISGRRSCRKPPILQERCLLRRLLLHRTKRWEIHLLL